MSVDALIEAAKGASPFTEAMIEDIRKVLAANDRQPNRLKRVTETAMRAHLCEAHGYVAGHCGFREHLRQVFGRTWQGK